MEKNVDDDDDEDRNPSCCINCCIKKNRTPCKCSVYLLALFKALEAERKIVIVTT